MSTPAVFEPLFNAAMGHPNGVAFLGNSEDDRHAIFASVLSGWDSGPSVVVQECALVPLPGSKVPALGSVLRAICVCHDGFTFRADRPVDEEYAELTNDECHLLNRAVRRARATLLSAKLEVAA